MIKVSIGSEVSYLARARNRTNNFTKVDILDIYTQRLELSGIAEMSVALDFYINLGFRYNQSFTRSAKQDLILDKRRLYNQYFQVFALLKIAN